ncbi:MAG: ribonuclease P protein component [Clostridia bacterium]|nr:ribonuclease P protein component [Clostridia bacterium]
MKEFAIRENHLFVKAYSKGKRYLGKTVCVYLLKDLRAGKLKRENPRKEYLNRLGFSVSPRLGNAVRRNRCKRIMRAAYRHILEVYELRKGYLIVISARPGATEASSADVFSELETAFARLGIISGKIDSV